MLKTNRNLVLLGGGHAHLEVLADWARRGGPDAHTVLVSPHRHTRYSGMLPGTVAGEYTAEEGLINLAALAQHAGAEFMLDRCLAIDPERRLVETEQGHSIPFEFCSVDTGGIGRARDILGRDPRILDVRPIGDFLNCLSRRVEMMRGKAKRIAVVGGGAGGVELAFALRRRFADEGAQVTLVAGESGLLSGFSSKAKSLARREMRRQGVVVIEQDARFEGSSLVAGQLSLEPVDLIVASLGAGAPEWPANSGIAVGMDGFIAVDRYQRSLSHPNILAAGDVATRQDGSVARSGVHAVHAGPVIAENLRRLVKDRHALRSYTPRRASLYLISTADGKAIASYGMFAAHGRWAGRLKRWTDLRWTTSFATLTRAM
ncbi:FAD-dependent oxidoreductase [Qipengyuania qiaonensis]|uniref:FAD-dependent oxidoreductase n=1 Tax=Qipengyuania qiaonensis TaxID=2867240 RepID=A0ABS7JCK8_9SPHN|nr:FAD-dependent oxidoreductase [Qipengyuania qiaonensis]MBX7484066.1 FAD-dependent oxidoreductase [Qipengyuania qiaonensis]